VVFDEAIPPLRVIFSSGAMVSIVGLKLTATCARRRVGFA
jgi:hypothetical protein